MWLMLQQKKPQDFVIATGESHTVREFVNEVANYLGMPIKWSGKGLKEVASDSKGNIVINLDKKFYRPHEVDNLLGDSRKARKILKWKPKVDFKGLVKLMVESDIKAIVGSTEHMHD
jgi:GDPmannose 4,6-dehydratase